MNFKFIFLLIIISKSSQFTPSTQNDSQNLASPIDLVVVPRIEWSAIASTQPLTKLSIPVPYVIIHHTATNNCDTKANCSQLVRNIQTLHMNLRNWWDIGYNFLVGGDGKAYEGRGWQFEGAHTLNYNAKSVGITFIGMFEIDKPPKKQIDACRKLIENGVNIGVIGKDYKVFGARQFSDTQSPGSALFEEVKHWEHWSKDIPPKI